MPNPPEMGRAAVTLSNGRRLAYACYGAENGAPVVYCHGGLSSHYDIAFADDRARERGVRLIAIDRPGIGESGRATGRRVADWGRDIDELTTSLGVDRFAVLGWSAGGPFALACAVSMPSRVRRTVTVGGMAPLENGQSASQLGLAMDRLLFPMCRRAPVAARMLLSMSKAIPRRALHRQLLRALTSQADRSVVAAMTPSEATRDLREAMRHGSMGIVDDYVVVGGDWGFRPEEVPGPVTMFQGDEDRLLPLSHAQSLAHRLPVVRMEIVAEAGHFLIHTHLDQVLSELVA
jgi:pimeloyl-ACP methyl ester carboxylesterase